MIEIKLRYRAAGVKCCGFKKSYCPFWDNDWRLWPESVHCAKYGTTLPTSDINYGIRTYRGQRCKKDYPRGFYYNKKAWLEDAK